MARLGFFEKENIKNKELGMDLMWYLWCGKNSPLFGKNKMATFERYFIDDKKTHLENKNPYFHSFFLSRKLIPFWSIFPMFFIDQT